jgi:beta-N-acetylhexosaminidase
MVRNNGQVLPLARFQLPPAESETFQAAPAPSTQVVAIIFTDTIHSDSGHGFENALLARRADATVFYVDNSLAVALTPQIMQAVAQANKVVVAAYIVPTPAKQVMVDGKLANTVGLEQRTGELLRQILEAAAAKTAVIAMGNPYMAQNFPNVQTYICTYSNASTSELSAVKTLFGELQPQGRLPVTLPGIANRAAGSK